MDINTSAIVPSNLSYSLSSTQSDTSVSQSPVQRLQDSSGMNSEAMQALLAPTGNAESDNNANTLFNAQGRLVESSAGATGSIVDITV